MEAKTGVMPSMGMHVCGQIEASGVERAQPQVQKGVWFSPIILQEVHHISSVLSPLFISSASAFLENECRNINKVCSASGH